MTVGPRRGVCLQACVRRAMGSQTRCLCSDPGSNHPCLPPATRAHRELTLIAGRQHLVLSFPCPLRTAPPTAPRRPRGQSVSHEALSRCRAQTWPSGTTSWVCPPGAHCLQGSQQEGGWTHQQTPDIGSCLRPALPGWGRGWDLGCSSRGPPAPIPCLWPAGGCPGLPAPSSPLPGGGMGPWDPWLCAGWGLGQVQQVFPRPRPRCSLLPR